MEWIADTFGSKRGLANLLRHQADWCFSPSLWRDHDLRGTRRLIFVCKGNICRSALAEVVATSLGIPAASYGLDTTPGKPANPNMTQAAQGVGYDLSEHRTTSINEYQPAPTDMILFMEPAHIRAFEADDGEQVRSALLGFWARPRLAYIHDPFMCSTSYFERSAALIQQAVINLAMDLRCQNG